MKIDHTDFVWVMMNFSYNIPTYGAICIFFFFSFLHTKKKGNHHFPRLICNGNNSQWFRFFSRFGVLLLRILEQSLFFWLLVDVLLRVGRKKSDRWKALGGRSQVDGVSRCCVEWCVCTRCSSFPLRILGFQTMPSSHRIF